MKALQATMLSLAMAMGGLLCQAQDTTIPFRQIQRDAQLSATAAVPPDEQDG
jgi:hypothetical protein